jgi:hypothetical protein
LFFACDHLAPLQQSDGIDDDMAKGKKNARIEVFRVGTHTPMGGTPLAFSADDLISVVDSYDAINAPAPIVVGHPKTDDPAFGWVEDFSFENGILSAGIKDIEPKFAAAVSGGQYKKVSMAFFSPDAAANPKPGTYYPKHIGFLGAMPPAVTGLKPVEFADHSDDDIVMFEGAIEFGTFDAENVGILFRGIRDWFIGKYGKETADEILPDWRINWVNDLDLEVEDLPGFAGVPEKPKKSKGNSMSKKDTVDFAAREAELEKREKKLAADQKIIDDEKLEKRKADNVAFADELIANEQLLPKLKDDVVSLLNSAGASEQTVSFASDDDLDLAAGLKSVLKRLPKIVSFGAYDMGDETVSFAEDGEAIAAAAKKYQSEQSTNGNYMTTEQAVEAVLKGARS